MKKSIGWTLLAILAAIVASCGDGGTPDQSGVSNAKVETGRTVLVTGATGTQGGAVVRELLNRGFSVRALTRNPDKPAAQALRALGADVVRGDYDDEASIADALKGVWGAFLVTNWWEHGVDVEITHGKTLIDAAVAADIEQVVFTSVANADRDTGVPHFDSKYVIEQHLRHQVINYSIVRPVSFMNNWLWRKDEFLAGGVAEPYSPDKRHHWIAARDIAYFVGEAFANPDEWNGRAIDIAGDVMTFGELSALLSDVLGRDVDYQRLSWGEYAATTNAEALKMAQWFDGVGYSVDVARLRELHPGMMSAREFLTELQWGQDAQD